MKLYWSPGTRAVRVAWMLEEAGLDRERVTVDLGRPVRGPELHAASPMGKVPALEDREVRMFAQHWRLDPVSPRPPRPKFVVIGPYDKSGPWRRRLTRHP